MAIRAAGPLCLAACLAFAGIRAEAATGCIIVGDPGSRVEYSGQVATPPFLADDCGKAALKSGRAQACFGLVEGRLDCEALSGGGGPARQSTQAGSGPGFLGEIRNVLSGDAQLRIGETRSLGELPGFPYGEIAMLDGVLQVHLDRAPGVDAQQFRIWIDEESPRLVVDLQRPRGVVQATSAQLPRGRSFHWELSTGENRFVGRFVTMDLPALEHAGLHPIDRAFDGSAAWQSMAIGGALGCEAAGLHGEARYMLERAGLSMSER